MTTKAAKLPPLPLWGPALECIAAGNDTSAAAVDALPGLLWAGYVERSGKAVAITERGRAALRHVRKKRRSAPAAEGVGGMIATPSLPVTCTPDRAWEMARAAGLEPLNVGGSIYRLLDSSGDHVGSIRTDGAHVRSIYWIGRAALSGLALTVGEVEAWLEARPSPPEAPPAPQPAILSNEPPPLIREVRALAASYGLELDVVLDTATQRKRGASASCWKVTTAAYKGGRILCRIEVHPDHVRVRGDWTEPHNALDRVRVVLDMQTQETP